MYHRKLQTSFAAMPSLCRRIATALACLAAIVTVPAAKAENLRCGTTTVRLFCDRRDELSVFCLESHAELISDQGQTRIVRTPKYLNSDLIPVAAGCAQGDGGDYLVVSLINGGNCDECERQVLFRIDGTEVTKEGGDFYALIKNLHISIQGKIREINLEYRASQKHKSGG